MNEEGAEAKGIAAFFDVDGTLIPEPSLERRFFRAVRDSGAIPIGNYFLWAQEALRLLPKGIAAMVHGNKRHWNEVRCHQVLQQMETIVFFEEAMERVAWHARQGHRIVLVSGMPEALARMVARALECELESQGAASQVFVCATPMEERNGRWTGRLLGEAMYGYEKFRAVKRIAQERRIELRGSHAYGNTLLDRPMLATVGHAHVVNPGRNLAAVANQCDWEIWHWHVERCTEKGLPLAETVIQGGESRA
ncbi:MAG TPA: HAD-IB family hydrolase [Candidatus Acidoferrum sp.]|nr:HAD-IB family hydrolase [Candidatus Acidoferrum sp.]